MFSELAGLFGVFAGESKAAAIAQIAINKALSIAQIIQNSAVAQMRALAELGPIAGPPVAAKIAAFGKVQAALAAATGFAQAAGAGGGGGGRAASVASTAEASQGAASAGPARVANISLTGDTFSRQSVEALFDEINKGLKQGYTINLVRA
jgi:hypothetical protein